MSSIRYGVEAETQVILDAFGVSSDLPEGAPVPIELTRTEPGDYEFACQVGMLRGRVVVS